MNYKLDLDEILTSTSKILYNHSVKKERERMEDIITTLTFCPDVTIPDVIYMIEQRQLELEQQPETPAVEIKGGK